MFLKGAFKDSSFFVQILILILVVFAGYIASSFTFYIYSFVKSGFSVETVINLLANFMSDGDILREAQFFQSIGIFIFPSILVAALFNDDHKAYLHLETDTSPSMMLLTVLSMLVAMPFINLTVSLNESIRFPEALSGLEQALRSMELQAQGFTELMLQTDKATVIMMNFLIVAVLAAIGEEFFFRGVLQNILRKVVRNEHVIIWTIAILFSAIHLQFYGFIPRMLLGAYFGYLLYFSKSMWLPILAHLTNNAVSLIDFYGSEKSPAFKELENIGAGETWMYGAVSFALWLFLFIIIMNKCRSKNFSS